MFLISWQVIDYSFNVEKSANEEFNADKDENDNYIKYKEENCKEIILRLNENERGMVFIKNEHKLFFDQLRNSVKYKIYLDLKNKGFYVSSGIKYGADFLLYNGNISYISFFSFYNGLFVKYFSISEVN